MSQTNDFLPPDYEAPKGNENYMKLQKGENKIRILSKPIVGWLDWKDNKPLRFEMDKKPEKSIDPQKAIRHFWAFIVWNYTTNSIQILEITQSSIQKSISALSKDEEWGAPYGYDIKITRKGDGMDTEYMINPVPPKPVANEIIAAYKAKPCELHLLFSGEDPFSKVEQATELQALDLPF